MRRDIGRSAALTVLSMSWLGSGLAMAAEPILPDTAEEHLAMAARYEAKAAAYEKEAGEHKAMIEAAYKAELHSKAPVRRAYERMRKHCQPIVRHAKQLARDMEAFTAWHRLQAEELSRSRSSESQ